MNQGNDDIIGFWGRPTATIDWCEKNYAVTHYVAEFFNTLSSLCMVGAGAFGVYMHAQGFDIRFPVCFATIIIVGIGSILFHGTLLFSLQLFDEVPMMFCVLVLCYSVIENKKERKYGNWFPVALTIWGISITAIMVMSGSHYNDGMMQLLEFYVFQGSFVVMSLTLYLHTIAIVLSPKAGRNIRRLWMSGSLVFLIGYIGWHVDLHFCSRMYSLPFNVPNPQLHAWWHLTASYGSYLICVLVTHDRSMTLGKSPKIQWVASILPYVELPQSPLRSYSEEKETLERVPLLAAEGDEAEECDTIIKKSEIKDSNENVNSKSAKSEIKQNAAVTTTNLKRKSNSNSSTQKSRASHVNEEIVSEVGVSVGVGKGIMDWVSSSGRRFEAIMKSISLHNKLIEENEET